MTMGKLQGRRILLVEDDYMQAREVTAYLQAEGAAVVGPAGRAADVPALLADGGADAALLDINLGAGASFETAEELQRCGVPFAFLTGYDQSAIPPHLDPVPRLEKPATEREVVQMVHSLL